MTMLRFRRAVAPALLITMTLQGINLSAQQPPRGPPADATAGTPDTPGSGAFAAIKEEIAALPRHVVYRPRDLAALGNRKLGLVVWGNGGCSDDAASSRFHLLELASHGYLVLASGRILSGPGAPPRAAAPVAAPAPAPARGTQAPRTLASDLAAAIDWAMAENQRTGSPYYGRIDPEQIAASGFSCGGLQAITIAGDPRLRTLVLHNTGVLNAGPSPMAGMDVSKDALNRIHTPVIYILGGEPDIAYANGMDDFQRITEQPVAVANLPVGHGGTFSHPNGGAAAEVAVNWLNWQLRGDADAGRHFLGADCRLCQDKAWTLQRRNFPPR